jgi:hypothetical protein
VSPAWAWLALLLGVTAYVVAYDVWAKLGRHHTLSRQMHDWLFQPNAATFILAGLAAVLVGLLVHFIRYHAGG